MEGKWTTNSGYLYFGEVNYSWKLYCRLTVPKVALRMIFLSLWALGVIAKWVAITFGTLPLQIQCPAPTYFSGTKYLVDLPKLIVSQTLLWVIPLTSTLHWRTPGSIVVIFTCIMHPHIHTQSFGRQFSSYGLKSIHTEVRVTNMFINSRRSLLMKMKLEMDVTRWGDSL